MRELIDQAADIVKLYQANREHLGLDYNVFTLMDIERREMETHEYMIYSILNYKEPSLKRQFIESFLINMGLPKSFVREQWTVDREYYTENYGRPDLFLASNGHRKKCVVVELKIDAGDQERQIKRYEDYVRKCGYEEYRIIYLTLDAKRPTEESCGGMKNPKRLLCRSYGEHVVSWLEDCIEICQGNNVDAGFIQQYKILLEKLTKEEKLENAMEKEIAGLIKNSEDLKACLGIEQALPLIKGQILYDFMDAIYHVMEKNGCEFLYDEYDCARDYYNGKAGNAEFVCKIRDLVVRNKSITLGLGVWATSTLRFYLGYFDEEMCLMDNNVFMGANRRINSRIEDVISGVINLEIRANQYFDIVGKDILDSYNERYDFKHFSENCAELKDKRTLKKEANRIAKELMCYIKEIVAILEETL